MASNPYYSYFREVVGKGSGEYYTGIGQIYKSRRGIQRGYGNFVSGFPYGARRGLGLGSTLMSLFRMATPLLKVLGTKAVDVFSNIAKDGIEGTNVREAAKRHGKAGVSELVAKIPKAFTGIINRKGSGNINRPLKQSNFSLNKTLDGDSYTTHIHRKRKLPLKHKQVGKKIKIKNNNNLESLYPALNYL